jgi:paraquat-inducible protein B
MNRPITDHFPRPVVKPLRWPLPLIWLIPVFALGAGGFYLYDYLVDHGPEITIRFGDGSGLKAGETIVRHLGVQVGKVTALELSSDQKQVAVRVQMERSGDVYAKTGALFWIVRPEINFESVSGLETLASGPYIEAVPGNGNRATEFTGLKNAPNALGDGLRLIVHGVRLERLQADSPIYYRGFQVGVIQGIQLSSDATGVDIQVFIERRYAPLVRTNSKFWILSGLDVKGGILTGVQMKLDSLRSLISGGIAFASPQENAGDPVADGTVFPLYEDPKPEWLNWAPRIQLPADDGREDGTIAPAHPQSETMSFH